jgi:type IV pilus assembly protein PilM
LVKKNVMLGVDIGSQSIKVIEMSLKKGEPIITGAAFQEFKSESADERQATINETVSKFKNKRTCVGVSGRTVCVRYIPLTIGSPQDLKRALVFEADKYIPFEVDEVYIDGHNISPYPETGQPEELRVMLVCCKKDTVEVATSNAISCGMSPAVVDVETFALGNALEAQRMAGGIETHEATVCVDVGAMKTSVNIVKNGISHFSREIYVGGGDFVTGIESRLGVDSDMAYQLMTEPGPDADQIDDIIATVFEEIASEVKMAIDFYENQYEEEVAEVLVCGGGALARKIMDLFAVSLDKRALRWDPFASFKTENVNLDDFGEHRSQFAVAVGLAARVLEA